MELAHLAAPPDEHYGLPVVVCPRCALACVRRPFAGQARWRMFVRGLSTVRRLLLGAWMFSLLTTLGVVMCAGIASGLSDALYRQPLSAIVSPNDLVRGRLVNWWTDEGFWIVPALAGLWSAQGLLAGLLFPHWRVRWYLAGMATLTAAVLAVPITLVGLARWARDGMSPMDAIPHELRNPTDAGSFLVPLTAGVLLSAIIMHIGLRSGRRLHRNRGLRSWKLRRARTKRNRQS